MMHILNLKKVHSYQQQVQGMMLAYSLLVVAKSEIVSNGEEQEKGRIEKQRK
jgi:hypothetical protein